MKPETTRKDTTMKPRINGAWVLFPKFTETDGRNWFVIYHREGNTEEQRMIYREFSALKIYRGQNV